MKDQRHLLIIATVAAPVAGCLVGTILWGLVNASLNPNGMTFDFQAVAILPVYGLAYAFTVGMVTMIVIGLPMHSALIRLGQRNAWSYGASGVFAGLMAPFLIMAFMSILYGDVYPWFRSMSDATSVLPLGTTLGVCIALAFWLIRRPDRDPPPQV